MPTGASQKTVETPFLYTREERERRDASIWTLVQGVLAPIQFVVFIISLSLIVAFFLTGDWQKEAEISIVIKTFILYTIMITGAIWEKEVFGSYLFVPAFFWEDVFSILVLFLHTAYLAALGFGALSPDSLMWLALAAYATYVINAGQFLWKLRRARLDMDARGPAGDPSSAIPGQDVQSSRIDSLRIAGEMR